MDTFPYDSWEEAIAAARDAGEGYFTFGSGGAVVLTILGVIAMVVAVALFVITEQRNLAEHAERIRSEEMI